LNYMNSEVFNPQTEVDLGNVKDLMADPK
jgi:hypothetical protein